MITSKDIVSKLESGILTVADVRALKALPYTLQWAEWVKLSDEVKPHFEGMLMIDEPYSSDENLDTSLFNGEGIIRLIDT